MLTQIIRRPIGACFVALSLALLGVMALRQLPVALLPPVELPVLTVRCDKPDSSAIELEEQLLRPLEEALSTVPALTRLEGRAAPGAVEVRLTLRADADLDGISSRLRERLSGLPLPTGAEPPRVLRYDPSAEPLLRLVLEPLPGGPSAATLATVARDELVPQIEGLSEVAAVRLRGGRESEVSVIPDPARLVAAGISADQLETAVRGAVTSRAVGIVYDPEGQRRVRVRGSIVRPDDLPKALVAPGITLGDVATVEQRLAEPEELAVALPPAAESPGTATSARAAGKATVGDGDALLVEIMAQADAGLVAASEVVRQRLALIAKPEIGDGSGLSRWSYEGGRLTLLTDRAEAVRTAIGEVKHATVEGAILAWLVLLVFLRALRPSLIVFLAIPLSVVGTFLLMSLFGVGLNLMSLGGLALGVGMLVDTAIVVLEAAERVGGAHQDGEPRKRAIAIGVGEVAGAVVASCLTSVAVFVPLAFLPGVLGRLFYDQAFTVSASHVVSLAVGLALVPTLLALPTLRRRREALPWSWPPVARNIWLPATALRWLLVNLARVLLLVLLALGWLVGVPLRLVARVLDRSCLAALALVERIYGRALDVVLARPALGLAGFAVALLLGAAFIPRLPVRLMPPSLSTRFTLDVELPRGRSVIDSATWARGYMRDLRAHWGDLEAVAVAGEDPRYAPGLTRRQDHELALVLTRAHRAADLEGERAFLIGLERLALEHGAVAAAATTPPLVDLGMGSANALDIAIRGDDPETLRTQALDYAARLRVLGCRGVSTSATSSSDEVLVVPDTARMLDAGLTLDQVQKTIAAAADIHQITDFIPRFNARQATTRTLPIRIRGPLREHQTSLLDELNLGTAAKPVPLSRIATITRAPGDGLIVRHNGSRVATLVAAALPPGSEVRAVLAGLQRAAPLPSGYDLVGRSVENNANDGALAMVGMLALSVFLVIVVMAVQFESLSQPLLVILAVPMAAAGAFPALWLCGHGFDVMSGIGLVVLVGVAVSNAIVLVSTANLRRAQGLAPLAAIAVAGRERLRPILMTTATSVLGLAPLAVGWGEAAELRAPLAVAVMGGLLSSTVLTLLSLPAVLLLTAGRGPRPADLEPTPEPVAAAQTAG